MPFDDIRSSGVIFGCEKDRDKTQGLPSVTLIWTTATYRGTWACLNIMGLCEL